MGTPLLQQIPLMNNSVLDKIEETPGYILLTFSSFFLIVYIKEEVFVTAP